MIDADRLLVVMLVGIGLLIVVPVVATGAWLAGLDGSGPLGGTVGPLWWLVGWVGLAVVVVATGVLGVRLISSTDDTTDEALRELRIAYARGEVDDEEYEKRYERLKEE